VIACHLKETIFYKAVFTVFCAFHNQNNNCIDAYMQDLNDNLFSKVCNKLLLLATSCQPCKITVH